MLARNLVLVAAAIFLLACSKKDGGDSKAPPSYSVRGVVKSQPGGRAITIHHEEIPDFVNREGQKVGMMSMSMPFGVAADVTLGDIAPGDKVEFTFAVDWGQKPPITVTGLAKLPAETGLSLSGR